VGTAAINEGMVALWCSGLPKRKKYSGGVSMYNKKEEAMRKEAREAIIETLKNRYTGY
jgi:hypothetical protein